MLKFCSVILPLLLVSMSSWADNVSLYKISIDRDDSNCKRFQFIEDQLDIDQCLKLKEVNIQRDELSESGQAPTRIISKGPHKGKLAWIYSCQAEAAIEDWKKTTLLCQRQ